MFLSYFLLLYFLKRQLPLLKIINDSIPFQLGSHIRVACKAIGKPTPTIQWLRNGKVLSENQHDISYADLTIDGVLTSHAGMYSCVVSNEGGNDERTVRLEVLGKSNSNSKLFLYLKIDTCSVVRYSSK